MHREYGAAGTAETDVTQSRAAISALASEEGLIQRLLPVIHRHRDVGLTSALGRATDVSEVDSEEPMQAEMSRQSHMSGIELRCAIGADPYSLFRLPQAVHAALHLDPSLRVDEVGHASPDAHA